MSDRKALRDMTADELMEKVLTIAANLQRASALIRRLRARVAHLEGRKAIWKNRAEHWKGEAIRARQGRPPKPRKMGRRNMDFWSKSVAGTVKARRAKMTPALSRAAREGGA